MKESLIVFNHSFPTIPGDFLFNYNNRPFLLKPKRDYVTCSKFAPNPLLSDIFSNPSFPLCRFHVGTLFIFAALEISS